MAIETIEELFIEEIRDLYDAEKQLVKALPKMAKAASSDELKTALAPGIASPPDSFTGCSTV